MFHGKEKEVGERHELSGQKKKKKKTRASIFDLKTKFLNSPHPQHWFGLQSVLRRATTSTNLRVIPARGGFPPFTPCVSAMFGQDSCSAAVSLALFFTQDQQKYWVCNSDAVALKYVISASLSHTWPRARSQSFQPYLSACPPTPSVVAVSNKTPCAPNCFTLCRKSPQTSTGCPAHPNWYLCGVHIITGLAGKSRTLASESFPQTTALEELLISSTDTSRMRLPLSFCCRKINQKGAFTLM